MGENFIIIVFSNPNTCIFDFKTPVISILCQFKRNFSFYSKFNSVSYDVKEDLTQPGFIHQETCGDFGIDIDDKINALFFGFYFGLFLFRFGGFLFLDGRFGFLGLFDGDARGVPELEVRVGAVSQVTGLGRRTTTSAQLYHLPDGGNLIDSPGVRDFSLCPVPVEELARGFVEFRPYLGHCRFHNCRHLKQPGCAVQAAARDGAISRQRVENYQALVATMGRPE